MDGSLTARERVAKAVAFERPDRAPLWGWAFLGEFERNWAAARVEPLDAYAGSDVAIVIGDESLRPSESRLIEEGVAHRTLVDGWGRTVRTRDGAFFEQALGYALDDSDVDGLVCEPPGAAVRWDGFDERIGRLRAEGKYVCAKIGGIYVRSHNLIDEAELLARMGEDEEFCHALFARMADHLTGMALETLRRADAWDEGLFVYDDIASTYSPMFSPRMFEKYLAPLYVKLLDTCRGSGCRHFFFHSDGNILPVMGLLASIGFEGFNPLEPRSVGLLPDLRKAYPKSVFFGGICNTEILPRGDRREIEAHVRPVLEMAREGGVVVGTHSLGGDVAPETLVFLRALIDRYGAYE
jgi:uroporphyrinogen decarboxylase